MPELPDIEAYVAALEPRIVGDVMEEIRIRGVSVLKSWDPPIAEARARLVASVGRLGKRIVIGLEGDLYIVIHLMVAGRLRWRLPGTAIPGRVGLGAFDFTSGTLLLTEAATKKRASIHLERGWDDVASHGRGGIDVAAASTSQFAARLRNERHTLKRSLTDPRIFDGIGGAYADEILHRAGLSPLAMSDGLDDSQVAGLHSAAVTVLAEWRERLVAEAKSAFPKVTAFRPEMAVHGKFGEPCPVCAAPVQRIVYASNETNYCPGCQTGGRILADRALSRLLKEDWPRSLDEL